MALSEPVETTLGPTPTVPEQRDLRKTGIHPDHWYPLARSRDVKHGKPFGTQFAGEPIVIVRTASGTLFALEDRCAHRQVPLSGGTVEGDIEATGRVEITDTARISGTVSGDAIAVAEGAVVEGVMQTRGRNEPTEFVEKRHGKKEE